MGAALRVLLVEDHQDDADLISHTLKRANYDARVTRVDTEAQFRAALASGAWDVILSDYSLPGFRCEDALRIARESDGNTPFIALSGAVDEETILNLLRAGAGDYVMKGNLARLPSAVEREIRNAEGRSQRQRLEAQLQQAMKMEAVGRLAGGVAHDFNNLLTVITGFAQLALLDDNPARAGLEQILLAAERASGLTRQLLAFSRQQALEPRVFDLNRLVGDMEKMLRRLIGEDIEVVTDVSEGPLNVKADPGQIEQVVLNLAVNSRDAMPRGGELRLKTSRQRMDGEAAVAHGLAEHEYCVISVSDNGAGIPASAMPHIFEPFFTTKPEGQGTGLGLSTVYGIVKQSGGAIHAHSEPDTGTTMTVFLPAATEAAEDTPFCEGASVGSGQETILVAEDEANVLDLVCKCLAARGFAVLAASSAEAALEALHARGPLGVDLLITDVVMPHIAGPVLASRASELLPNLRVLFMSGYTEDVISHYGISRRNAAFLQKPFAPTELVRKVRQLLDRKLAPKTVSASSNVGQASK
jgi:signal transduction histidine kinase/ActR/RegA family two-component response regulator